MTGVQTCALPISSAPSASQSAGQGGLQLGSTLCPMAARPPEEASRPLPRVQSHPVRLLIAAGDGASGVRAPPWCTGLPASSWWCPAAEVTVQCPPGVTPATLTVGLPGDMHGVGMTAAFPSQSSACKDGGWVPRPSIQAQVRASADCPPSRGVLAVTVRARIEVATKRQAGGSGVKIGRAHV